MENFRMYINGRMPEVIEHAEKLGFRVSVNIDDPFVHLRDELFEPGAKFLYSYSSMTAFAESKKKEISVGEFLKMDNGYEFKHDELVLVRDNDCDCWQFAAFKKDGHIFPKDAYTTYGPDSDGAVCWEQCIPFKGNEHLLGTNNKE